MTEPRTYPHGVPCWVDLEQPDPAAACAFYGELLGWSFDEAVPDGAPGSYLIATLDGQDVGAVAPGDAGWSTYVAVDDADDAAAAVARAGGTIVAAPADAGPGGRGAVCRDAAGASFRLWQARRRLGAQAVNQPGAWTFSGLVAEDVAAAERWYGDLFGWEATGPLWRRPGYGDHLEATCDPDIRTRQELAPDGFEDAIAFLLSAADEDRPPGWHVMFAVADRDDAAARAQSLGATVTRRFDEAWTRSARVRDPQGSTFTISQFTPPEP